MILDKYSQEYNSDDLQNEWKSKINQFKTVQSDIKDFSDVFDSLIHLTEYISESHFSSQFFPGTDMSELKISPVKNCRILSQKVMRIHCAENGKGPFAITVVNDDNETFDFTCTNRNLIKPFLDNIEKLEEM